MPRFETHVPLLELFKPELSYSVVSDDPGRLIPVSSSKNARLLSHGFPGYEGKICLTSNQKSSIPWQHLRDSHHLVFLAQWARLEVQHTGWNLTCLVDATKGAFSRRREYRGRTGFLDERDEGHNGIRDFILVEREKYDEFSEKPLQYHLLMISWLKGIAYRVASAQIDQDVWLEAKPKERLICLG
jgi:hypothetical protein